MYYVYEWYIVLTGEVIYVGKGTRRRYKVTKHNKLFNDMIRRCECDSRIVRWFDTEQEAFDYEFVRINELKAQGQCVCNIQKGGFGGSTEWWTDELRKRYSENNVMKSELQRKRMSQNNPMKNKAVAEKSNSVKRKVVIVGKREYPSVKAACKANGVASTVIANWCKKGINPNGDLCRYADAPQAIFTDKRYNKGSCRAVVYNGVVYESVTDFAKDIGIGVGTATSWLRRGYNPSGMPCRYNGDDKEYTFVNRYVARNKAKAKPIVVNGKEYKSCEEASQKLHIPRSTLYSYLQGAKHNDKYICKYGNQQPSRGNTDSSTTEGSTTNG